MLVTVCERGGGDPAPKICVGSLSNNARVQGRGHEEALSTIFIHRVGGGNHAPKTYAGRGVYARGGVNRPNSPLIR